MKVAFPTQEDFGLESIVYSHYGSANFFIIVDTDTGNFENIVNSDKDHHHGQCQPVNALGGNPVDAVAVGGIGRGALNKLMTAGIKTFRAVEGTISENLELINKNRLPEFLPNQTCKGHGSEGICVH